MAPRAPGPTIAVFVVARPGTTLSVEVAEPVPHGYATTQPMPAGEAAVTVTTAAIALGGNPTAPTTGTSMSVSAGTRTPPGRVSTKRVGAMTVTGEPAGKYPNASTMMLARVLVLMQIEPSAAGLTMPKFGVAGCGM